MKVGWICWDHRVHKRGRVEIGRAYLPSQLERTTQLYSWWVDIVKGRGSAPPTVTRLSKFFQSRWNVRQKMANATLCVLCGWDRTLHWISRLGGRVRGCTMCRVGYARWGGGGDFSAAHAIAKILWNFVSASKILFVTRAEGEWEWEWPGELLGNQSRERLRERKRAAAFYNYLDGGQSGLGGWCQRLCSVPLFYESSEQKQEGGRRVTIASHMKASNELGPPPPQPKASVAPPPPKGPRG